MAFRARSPLLAFRVWSKASDGAGRDEPAKARRGGGSTYPRGPTRRKLAPVPSAGLDARVGRVGRSPSTPRRPPERPRSRMTPQRVAVVTGAARGIGAATAQRLGRDGFAVGVLDLDEAACELVAGRIRDAGGRAVGVGVDVTDTAQVEGGVARVADELGPPVVLVNNAGIIRDNLIFRMTEV